MLGFSELKARFGEKVKTTPPARVIVISFVFIILVGTLLLLLPISSKVGGASPIDALFTITSATCVTGLVVGDTFTLWTPFGQGVILVCIQLGGLGLSTLAIGFSLLVRRKLGIREMKLASETSGGNGLNLAGLLKLTIQFTFACEAIGACLLAIRFVPMFGVRGIWPSIFCAISAYCNAGFDVLGFVEGNSSLTAFAGDPLVTLTISFLIIIGGLGFIVVQDIYVCKIQPIIKHKDTLRLNFHSQICLRGTVILLVIGTLGFFVLEFNNTMSHLNILEKLNDAFFQSTNTRTAGFATVNIGAQYEFTKILSVMLMFIGACPGSTGGGIKCSRMLILLRAIRREIHQIAHPRSVEVVRLEGKVVDEKTLHSVLAFIGCYMLILLGTALIVSLDDVSFAVSFSAALTCLSNVGPGLQEIGPVGSFAAFSPLSKVVLSICMIAGRLEIFPILILFSPSTRSRS